MRDTNELFQALSKSRFRQRQQLNDRDRAYLMRHGIPVIVTHGRMFIVQRLKQAQPANDGKQTPMRGHPAFVAQHATATCCRSCLRKWHSIEKNRPLMDEEVEYIVAILERWLLDQIQVAPSSITTTNLFSAQSTCDESYQPPKETLKWIWELRFDMPTG